MSERSEAVRALQISSRSRAHACGAFPARVHSVYRRGGQTHPNLGPAAMGWNIWRAASAANERRRHSQERERVTHRKRRAPAARPILKRIVRGGVLAIARPALKRSVL
jgi:hypothetical protein